MNTDKFRRDFYARLADPMTAELLLDHVDHLTYFIKDDLGRYVSVNETLVHRCGAKDKRDMIGRTAEETFPPPLGKYFLRQDLEVVRSSRPLVNELEQHPYPQRKTGWCLTTKLPLMDPDDRAIGLVGFSRDLQSPDQDPIAYESVARVIAHIKDHLDEPLTTAELAALTNLSTWQFDQRVRELFGLTTGQLVLQTRMDAAAKRIRDPHQTLISIAMAVGYSDQSAFTRQFRKTFGMTPSQYRSKEA